MRTKMGLLAKTHSSFVMALLVFGFATSSNRAIGACSLTPERATNTVGQTHAVTATVTTNGTPAAGVLVSFSIASGPNAGTAGGNFTTGAGGTAIFNYTGIGGAGTDIIRATGIVSTVAFTCMATQVWVVAGPSIQCPANIVTNSASGACSRSVAFTPVASGSPMPTIRCRIGSTAITSPHTFSAGINNVTCMASNVNGTASCSFTVTVTESEPPSMTCPNDVFMGVLPGESSAVVNFDPPTAMDNCGDPTVVCDPASGSTFAMGVTPVTCTATDSAGNTNGCAFAVTVEEGQVEPHDLAVVKIKAPRFVNLTARLPAVTKRVVVTIQNRSPHTEAFFDAAQLEGLVTLTVESLDPNTCFDLTPVLLQRPPQRRLPFNLRPKQKLNVYFEVTFDCAVNPVKGRGQEDFRYIAQVHHEAIDTVPDTHPECDICPRGPLEGFVDPNPNGRIRDKGCGAPVGDGTFGNDVLTDVSVR